jgi:DNA-binding CsgD family transcriptional regulator
MTEAEREITRRLIRGDTYAEIAVRRGVSEHTVANQVCALLDKLNAESTSALISRLAELQVVDA